MITDLGIHNGAWWAVLFSVKIKTCIFSKHTYMCQLHVLSLMNNHTCDHIVSLIIFQIQLYYFNITCISSLPLLLLCMTKKRDKHLYFFNTLVLSFLWSSAFLWLTFIIKNHLLKVHRVSESIVLRWNCGKYFYFFSDIQ